MGKRGSGGKQHGNAQSMKLWLRIGSGLALGLAVWASFQQVRSPSPSHSSSAAADDDDTLDDDDGLGGRFESIREALFSSEGGSAFGEDGRKGGDGRTSRFSDASYWEERYTKAKKEYDWYGTWNGQSPVTMKRYVAPYLPKLPSIAILNAGCGNSRLAAELHADGYHNVTSVDISGTVIDKMKAKFGNLAGLSFMQMDVTALNFGNSSFDVVMEKGTLDAMYTGASAQVKHAVAEFFRVLRPGGVLVSMSFGMPQSRQELNMTMGDPKQLQPGWESFNTIKVDRKETAAQAFYIYVMQKPS